MKRFGLLIVFLVMAADTMAEESQRVRAFYPLLKELHETVCHPGWSPVAQGKAQERQVKINAAIAQLNADPEMTVEERLAVNEAYREAVICGKDPTGEWFTEN